MSYMGTAIAQMRRRLLRTDEGSVLLEWALSLSIFLALLLGTLELSLVYFAYSEVTDGAQQAARWAAVRGSQSCNNIPGMSNCNATTTDIQSFVQGLGYPGLDPAKLDVITQWEQASSTTPTTWSTCNGGCSNAPKNIVQVTVSYKVPTFFPFPSNFSLNATSQTVTVSSTSSMVISQ